MPRDEAGNADLVRSFLWHKFIKLLFEHIVKRFSLVEFILNRFSVLNLHIALFNHSFELILCQLNIFLKRTVPLFKLIHVLHLIIISRRAITDLRLEDFIFGSKLDQFFLRFLFIVLIVDLGVELGVDLSVDLGVELVVDFDIRVLFLDIIL